MGDGRWEMTGARDETRLHVHICATWQLGQHNPWLVCVWTSVNRLRVDRLFRQPGSKNSLRDDVELDLLRRGHGEGLESTLASYVREEPKNESQTNFFIPTHANRDHSQQRLGPSYHPPTHVADHRAHHHVEHHPGHVDHHPDHDANYHPPPTATPHNHTKEGKRKDRLSVARLVAAEKE